MSDRAQFIVLCEDLQSQVFIVRALVRAGANPRRIRRVPLPSEANGGAGHGFVIKHYPSEVRAFRTQNANAKTALVVHIDADPTHTVAQRHTQLAEALKEAGHPARGSEEPIAELVPKRNIETWIYALDADLAARLGHPLNEVTAYPKFESKRECAQAAENFANHAREGTSPATATHIPSLLDGLKEFRRLP